MASARLVFAVILFCTLNALVRCEIPTVILGQTLDFSNQISKEYRKGLLAAFNETNFNLVVGNNNILKFVINSLDDAGSDVQAVSNIQSLIAGNATYIIGQSGAESALEAGANAASNANTPYLAPSSGNPALYSRSAQNIVNIRVSYMDELVGLVDYLTYDSGISRISILYENTTLSASLANYTRYILSTIGLRVEISSSYDATGSDASLSSALQGMQNATPEAIIMIGDYRPLARFTALARSRWPDIVYATISKANTDAFTSTISLTGGSTSNIVVSQVVPPASSGAPLILSYQAALRKSGFSSPADQSFASIEGYLAGKAIYTVFWNAYVFSGAYTVDAFYSALRFGTGIQIPVSGFTYPMGPFTDSCMQGSRSVYISAASGATSYAFMKTLTYTSCSADLSYLMKPIVFGQSIGTDAASVSFKAGVKAAFAEYNAETGVQYFNPSNPRYLRRRLVYSPLEDAGLANATAVNLQKFGADNVFGLIGPTGTDSAITASYLATVPVVGAYSGALELRRAGLKRLINIRASELDEAAGIVDYLAQQKITRVGVYYNPTMFQATNGYQSLLDALASKNMNSTKTTTTQALSDAIDNLKNANVQAVIVYGAAQELERFAQSAHDSEALKELIYVAYSMASPSNWVLGSTAKIYQSTVVPPFDYGSPAVVSFRKAFPSTLVSNLAAFEGYITGRAIGSILKMYQTDTLEANADGRTNFLNVVYPAVINVEGLGYGPYSDQCNQGARQVWMAQVSGQNISFVSTYRFTGCMSQFVFNNQTSFLRPEESFKSATIGIAVGVAVPVVIVVVIIAFFFSRKFINNAKKKGDDDDDIEYMMPDKITSTFADPKIPGAFPFLISPLQLIFGGSEQPDVDKMVSDFVTISNPLGNKPYKFNFLLPPKSDKFQLTIEPRRGKLRPGETRDVRIDLVFFCTTRLNCKIMLEAQPTTGEIPPVHCVLSIDKGSALSTKLDFDELKMTGAPIGDGSFGTVYRGTWRGQDVAIKMLKAQMDLSEMQLADLLREVNIMNKLRNPNIVSFAGAVTTPGKMCLVTEFVPLGNLTRYLGKNMLSYAQKVKIAIDAANGMYFLHSGGILHRDLKPDNLLVCSLNVNAPAMIKLSDFGSSRSINEELSRNYTSGIGTPIYMAPEILTKEAYSVKADVYSFSILLYELYDEKEPYQDFKHSWDVARYVTEGKRPAKIKGCPEDYWAIIEKCWDHDPMKRPNFVDILEDLQEIFRNLPEESILSAIANTFGSVRGSNGELSADPRYGKLRSMSKSEGYRLVVEKIRENYEQDKEKEMKTKSLGRDEGRRRKHRRRSKAGSKAKSAPNPEDKERRRSKHKNVEMDEITIDVDHQLQQQNNSKTKTIGVSFDPYAKV